MQIFSLCAKGGTATEKMRCSSSIPPGRNPYYPCRYQRPRSRAFISSAIPPASTSLRIAFRSCLVLVVVLFFGSAATMPLGRDISASSVESLKLPLGARLAEAFIAIVAVGLVTLVYTLLIQRGSLIATTCLYPRRPIEANISQLLNAIWPLSSEGPDCSWDSKGLARKGQFEYNVQLYYIGKMADDPKDGLVAKGRQQAEAHLSGPENQRPVWLTSGSPLTRNIVQTMVWEWISMWLMIFMNISTLLFNGFFTNSPSLDSYPRLAILLMYSAAYMAHFFYVWITALDFFKLVFAGASWSLLERSKFVIAETQNLQGHSAGAPFEFRSIDKANQAYVPTTFSAKLGSGSTPSTVHETNKQDPKPSGATAELSTALETINASQKAERDYATEASRMALDRVMANAMVMMAVTLSSGFASWTSNQFTDNTPNNTATTQIGSLALLGFLSLGSTTMFSSAMQLNIVKSSFRTILSLKETKINGLALELHRKTRARRGTASASERGPRRRAAAFTEPDSLPAADPSIVDFFAANRSLGSAGLLGMVAFGPGYAMLPRSSDYDRESAEVDFDLVAPVDGGRVILTTRQSDRHDQRQDGGNADPVVVCYVQDEKFGKEQC